MPDMKSPSEVFSDIRKALDTIPGPSDIAKKIGIPTPEDFEKRNHEERTAVIQKATQGSADISAYGSTPAGIISAFLPKPPKFMDLAPSILKFD